MLDIAIDIRYKILDIDVDITSKDLGFRIRIQNSGFGRGNRWAVAGGTAGQHVFYRVLYLLYENPLGKPS